MVTFKDEGEDEGEEDEGDEDEGEDEGGRRGKDEGKDEGASCQAAQLWTSSAMRCTSASPKAFVFSFFLNSGSRFL